MGDRSYFTEGLMHWHRHHNRRVLPWKSEADPYKIWLSEIILQQTRAAQGLPYYLKFIAAFPTVHDLAAASDDAAFKLWEGLGYYARCRNMLATARQISSEYAGIFPITYEGLLALKGIGPYTAAAIASFAYGLPQAVVDGNVYRVLARYFGISTPTDGTEGKKRFQALADSVLDRSDPGSFNQAIMDHGALICTPAAPKCAACPVEAGCLARAQGLIAELPVRAKRPAVRIRYFHYLLLLRDGRLWLRLRREKDIWKGLYEPLLLEAEGKLGSRELVIHDAYQRLKMNKLPEYEGSLTQRLSHQLIEAAYFTVQDADRTSLPEDGLWVPLERIKEYPFPRIHVTFFEKKGYF